MLMFRSTHYRLLQAALDERKERYEEKLQRLESEHRAALHAKEEECIELRAKVIKLKKQRNEARAQLANAPTRFQSASREEDPNLRVYKRLTEQEQWEVDEMRKDLSRLKEQAETLRQQAAEGDEVAKANYQGAQQVYMECLEQYGPAFQRYGMQYQP